MFLFLNDENNRNVFFFVFVSCILVLKVCYKIKVVFRDFENLKLLFSCIVLKGFML